MQYFKVPLREEATVASWCGLCMKPYPPAHPHLTASTIHLHPLMQPTTTHKAQSKLKQTLSFDSAVSAES